MHQKNVRSIICFAFTILFSFSIIAQSVSISDTGSIPHPSAILDLNASDKGLLIPRILEQNLPNSPIEGLLVYITNGSNPGFRVFEDGQWRAMITENADQSIWHRSGDVLTYTFDNVSIGEIVYGPAFSVEPNSNSSTIVHVADNSGGAMLRVESDRVKIGESSEFFGSYGMLEIQEAVAGIYFSIGGGFPFFNVSNNGVYIGSDQELITSQLNTSVDHNLNINSGGGNLAVGFPLDNTPTSRLQVNPIGSLNNNGVLDPTKSGFLVGDANFGIMMDANQIEGLGSTTFINLNSDQSVSLATGGGNVGLGVQDPDYKLDVFDDDWQLRLRNDNETNTNSWYIGSSGPTWNAGGGKFLISPNGQSINASITIDEAGLVGIGNTSPSNRLHVMGGNDLNLSSGGYLQLGGSSSINLVMDENEISARNNGAASGLFLNKDGGRVQVGDGNFTITEAGQVGIGIDPTYALHLPDAFDSGEARAFAWSTYSDKRIKSNFQKQKYGIKEIMLLNPLQYDQHESSFTKDGLSVSQASKNTIGFIAQEVFEIIPEAVVRPTNDDTELWGMDYDKLIPVLIKGMQEQQALIKDLLESTEMLKYKLEHEIEHNKSIEERLATIENQ